MATAKNPKKNARNKKENIIDNEESLNEEALEDQSSQLPEEQILEIKKPISATKKKNTKNKASINKVHNLFPVSDILPSAGAIEEELFEEKKAVKKITKRKLAEEKTKSYLISFETPEEVELLKSIENFAQISDHSINKSILLLAYKALNEENNKNKEVFFKPDPEFGIELNENFKKIEDKIQNEIDNLKLEFLEQIQCLLESDRSQVNNSKDDKNWFQNILKYI